MNRKWLILPLILALAFFFRVIDIQKNSLYGDELTLTLDAYSLLQTGRDQNGQFLPLTFTMSEGRSPVYVYFAVPFIALFGPNEIGVRILSVLSGIGIVLLLYLLTKHLLNENIALAAVALAAISPWDIALSRGAFETHLALFLALLGIYTLMRVKEKPWFLLISALSFGLSIHAYHSYKPIIPIFLLFLIWFIKAWKLISIKFTRVYLGSAVFIFLMFVILWFSQIGKGSDVRFQNISVFNDQDLKEKIVQNINNTRLMSNLPFGIASFFDNKFISYSFLIGENYLDNLMPNFLFIHGDSNPRHNPATMGELFLGQLVLILFGFSVVFKNNPRLLIFLLGWILLSPIATAFVGGPHALRSAFMIPPLIILSACGLIGFWNFSKSYIWGKAIILLICFALLVQFIFFAQRLYFLSANTFEKFWSKPAKQVSLLVFNDQNKFDNVILSSRLDNIEYALPVYGKIKPELVIEQNKNPYFLSGYKFKKFGNILIGSVNKENIANFLDDLPGSVLYIGVPSEKEVLPQSEMIFGKDQLPSFIVVRKT
ncbi:MAG: glycosyltransferase family 39 protein [Candidatus Daviesbacteria bacterium]